jgi:soluble lytic murein transglycosylase-like protein
VKKFAYLAHCRSRVAAMMACAMLGMVVTATARSEGASSTSDLRKLAIAMEHGEGVPRDPKKAAELYCEAAKAGDVDAQFNLGWMLANARGVPRDDGHAAFFFELAARQGHPQAERMLRQVGEPSAEPPPCMAPKIEPPAVADAGEDALARYLEAVPADKKKLVDLLMKLAPEYGVHPYFALAIARTESNLNPLALSVKNAQGVMQLIPETSVRFNVTKPFDPEQNIRGGLSYLRWLLAYFRGNVTLVAAAYNAGEGAVNRYRGIPPYAETQSYVKKIMQVFRKADHPFDARVTGPSPELPRIRAAAAM